MLKMARDQYSKIVKDLFPKASATKRSLGGSIMTDGTMRGSQSNSDLFYFKK